VQKKKQQSRRRDYGKRKPSTGLMRRPVQSLVITDPQGLLPKAEVAVNALGEEATLGALGLVEIKLTEKEEAVLARPVVASDVLIKPTGQPYLSHPSYTRLFNEAFGRLGWSIVPRSKPILTDGSVVCPYILFIHGRPAAFAMGEQPYFANNREQSYGDALEATVASALRRCAKRLGVCLELWDKRWLRLWMGEFAVRVKITHDDPKKQWVWRRQDDPPFWNEVTPGRQRTEPAQGDVEVPREVFHPPTRNAAPPAARQQAPPPASHSASGNLITEKQIKRLHAIAHGAGRKSPEVKDWLWRRFKLDSSSKITRELYDSVCAWLEQPGPLPLE
jgi:hypothetical protein